MSSDSSIPSLPPNNQSSDGKERSMDSVRDLLLNQDRDWVKEELKTAGTKIKLLEDELARLKQEQIDERETTTHAQAGLQTMLDSADAKIDALESSLEQIQNDKADEIKIIPSVRDEFSGLAGNAARQETEALSDALSPIIFPAMNSAISDAMRDLQRSIDARRAKATASMPALKNILYGIRGVKPSEVTMRDALPFRIVQAFLIQNGSGLLVAHYSSNDSAADSDLVSAMLTAIRDFVGDAFSQDNTPSSLDSVQYGDKEIVLKNGEAVYCALVIDGTVPAGLSTRMQAYVSETNTDHRIDLLAYTGDADTIPDLNPSLEAFVADIHANPILEEPMPADFQRTAKLAGGCLILFLLVSLCFGLWFVSSLIPIALDPSSYQINQSASVDNQISSYVVGIAIEDSWVYSEPSYNGEQVYQLRKKQKSRILQSQGDWLQIDYNQGQPSGWVKKEDLDLAPAIPSNNIYLTPTAQP